MNEIEKEIARCSKLLDNKSKSRWLWGYVDGLKKALELEKRHGRKDKELTG